MVKLNAMFFPIIGQHFPFPIFFGYVEDIIHGTPGVLKMKRKVGGLAQCLLTTERIWFTSRNSKITAQERQ